MKKFLVNYYAMIMMVLFIIYNKVLKHLKIGGNLYQIFMLFLIIINIIVLIKFREKIKFKALIIVVYFFIWVLLSKNAWQCTFGLSNMIALMIIGYMESNSLKVITVLITLFFVIFSMPLFFASILAFGVIGEDKEIERNDIYDDMHYYCENNYEVYSYSAGAMDSFHYSIGKYYEFLDINGIIYVSYNERNEVSEKEYSNYLKRHKCRLVGDINGSK